MDKIKIGNRTFFLGVITPGVLESIKDKIENVSIPDPGKDGKTDIGDALLIVLTAIFDGDEEQALKIGQELAETEIQNVKIEQLTEAFQLIRKKIEG